MASEGERERSGGELELRVCEENNSLASKARRHRDLIGKLHIAMHGVCFSICVSTILPCMVYVYISLCIYHIAMHGVCIYQSVCIHQMFTQRNVKW